MGIYDSHACLTDVGVSGAGTIEREIANKITPHLVVFAHEKTQTIGTDKVRQPCVCVLGANQALLKFFSLLQHVYINRWCFPLRSTGVLQSAARYGNVAAQCA